MPLYKHDTHVVTFSPQRVIEPHFHDCDEVWVVLEGKAKAKLTAPRRGPNDEPASEEFLLEPGDVWVILVGELHEAVPITPEFKIMGLPCTVVPGATERHLHHEDARYTPSLQLTRTPWAE